MRRFTDLTLIGTVRSALLDQRFRLEAQTVVSFGDVPATVDFLLADDFSYDDEAVTKVRGNAAAAGLLIDVASAFETVADWSADAAKAALSETAVAAGAKPGQLMFPLRVALSGRGHGPDLGDILNLLGKERCVKRVRKFAHKLG